MNNKILNSVQPNRNARSVLSNYAELNVRSYIQNNGSIELVSRVLNESADDRTFETKPAPSSKLRSILPSDRPSERVSILPSDRPSDRPLKSVKE